MCQIALSRVCLTAPSARLWPRRGLRRWYCAAGELALTRIAAMAVSSSAKSSHLEPSRVRPERRLPADWSLPGHWPAQDARCRADAKRVMSVPISARMHSAPRRWMPTIVHSSSTAGAKGRSCSSIASDKRSMCSARKSMWARIAPIQRRWCSSKWPASASRRAGIFFAHLPPRELRQHVRIGLAGDQRVEHVAPGLAHHVRCDAVELDAGVFERLVQPVDLAGALLDLRLAIAREVAQLAERLRAHEARLPAQPRGVGDVGLASRHLLDM